MTDSGLRAGGLMVPPHVYRSVAEMIAPVCRSLPAARTGDVAAITMQATYGNHGDVHLHAGCQFLRKTFGGFERGYWRNLDAGDDTYLALAVTFTRLGCEAPMRILLNRLLPEFSSSEEPEIISLVLSVDGFAILSETPLDRLREALGTSVVPVTQDAIDRCIRIVGPDAESNHEALKLGFNRRAVTEMVLHCFPIRWRGAEVPIELT